MFSSHDHRRPGRLTRRRGQARRAPRTPSFEPLEARVVLAHFYTVTGFGDGTDGATHGGAGTSASPFQVATLRGAIIDTNSDANSTITLPAGTYTLSLTGHSDDNTAGQLSVTSGLTIKGAGSASTIIQAGTTATNGVDKVFSFNPLANSPGFPVSLSGLTIQHGRNQVTDFFPGEYFGGAFDFDAGSNGQGSLTMNDVTVTQNSTVDGPGGGITLFDGGTISITNSVFSHNTSNSQAGRGVGGGAIDIESNNGNAASVTITGSTFDNNIVNGAGGSDPGGAIASSLSASSTSTTLLTITGSTITNNTTTGLGGGIYQTGTGQSSISGTNLSNNTAGNTGGGLYFSGSTGSTLTVTNSTIDGNAADGTAGGGDNGGGGGVYAAGGTINASDSRIVRNTASIGGSAADANPGQGTVSVADNWFGSNAPAASLFGSSGVTSTPYLVMTFSASPTTLNSGDTSTLFASVDTNSLGRGGFTVPDGTTTVTFAGGTKGSVRPSSETLTSGTASSTFTPTPGASGTASVSSTIDNQTLSTNLTLNGNVAPAVTTNPTNVTVNAGQTATFTAAASGTPTPTVQWQVSTNGGSSFSKVAGATATTFSFTAAAGQNGNEYRAVFTNAAGSATTTAATLTVLSAPTITTNPQDDSSTVNNAAFFFASASGNPTPTVQWQVSTNGGSTFTDIAGATSTVLSFPATADQNGNEYRAVFTNSLGIATTTAATLTITKTAPLIVLNPSSQAVNAGQSVRFLAAADGYPASTLQWQVSTDGGTTFTDIAGATSNLLTFTAAAGQNGDEYRAVFTNSVGTATTSAATLTVNSAPTITTNPVSQAVNAGQSASFTAAASGNPTPTVQWQVSTNGGSTFANISGATSTSLTFTAAAGQNGNEYRAVFTSSMGSATTTAATLTVVSAPTANGQSVTVNQDTAKAITLTGSDPNSPARPLTYIVTASPAHGSLSGTAPNLTYTPTAGYFGPDSFRYKVNNGALDSNVATVSITVVGKPTAHGQSVTVNQDTAKAITLTGSDPNTPPRSLTYIVTASPAHGSLSGTAPNLTYTPNAGYFGPDSFQFKDNNGVLDSNVATVSITVNPAQQATVSSTVGVKWGTAGSATLLTAMDGLRLLPSGRTTDLPWLGIDALSITLSAPESLSSADVSVTGIAVANYGPVSISGLGTSYTIILAQPINAADKVTVTIGNANIATFTRRLDVLPGDVDDNGLVNIQDATIVHSAYSGFAGVIPSIFTDTNGDGVTDVSDYNAIRRRLGTQLPPTRPNA